jgi:hypothetical protein
MRRQDGERGAVTIEFAMVLVPLLMMMLGGIEYGQFAYTNSVLKSAMRDVSRMAATGGRSINELNLTVKNRLAEVGIPAADITTSARSYAQFGDLYSKSEPITQDNEPKGGAPGSGDCFLDFDRNGSWSAETTGGADDVLHYEVTARYKLMFGFLGVLAGGRNADGDKNWFGADDGVIVLRANTTIRNEPFNNPPETCIP